MEILTILWSVHSLFRRNDLATADAPPWPTSISSYSQTLPSVMPETQGSPVNHPNKSHFLDSLVLEHGGCNHDHDLKHPLVPSLPSTS